MAKKNSMPDFTSAFTSALSADLREAAAKMRRMSQPPKHSELHPNDPHQESGADTPSAPSPVDVPSSPAPETGLPAVTPEEIVPQTVPPARLSVTDPSHPEETPVLPPATPQSDATSPSVAPEDPALKSAAEVSTPAADEPALPGHDTSMTADDCHLQSLTVSDSHPLSSGICRSDSSVTVSDSHATVINCHQVSSEKEDASATENNPVPGDDSLLPINCHQLSSTVSDTSSKRTLLPPSAASEPVPDSTVSPEKHPQLPAGVSDSHQLSLTVTPKDAQKKICSINEVQAEEPCDVQAVASATITAQLGGARQVLLAALQELRKQSPQIVVNLKRLAPILGLSYGTVRNTISRLVHEGLLCTTQVRTGEVHGVCIEFLDDTSLLSSTVTLLPSQGVIDSHQQSLTVTDSHQASAPMTPHDTSIWDTEPALIQMLWPHAAAAGFGTVQLTQLRRAYQIQGWAAHNVARCLRYLDWELAQSSDPTHVTEWLRCMQQQGHYPRPEGYVDPEVLRLRQQAEEEAALAEARQPR